MIELKKYASSGYYSPFIFKIYRDFWIVDYDSNKCTFEFQPIADLCDSQGVLRHGPTLYLIDEFTSMSVSFIDTFYITRGSVSVCLSFDKFEDLRSCNKYQISCWLTKKSLKDLFIKYEIRDEKGNILGEGKHNKRVIIAKF